MVRSLTAAEIVDGWHESLVLAMKRGDADAAYQLARVFLRRCRELRLVPDADTYDTPGESICRNARSRP